MHPNSESRQLGTNKFEHTYIPRTAYIQTSCSERQKLCAMSPDELVKRFVCYLVLIELFFVIFESINDFISIRISQCGPVRIFALCNYEVLVMIRSSREIQALLSPAVKYRKKQKKYHYGSWYGFKTVS